MISKSQRKKGPRDLNKSSAQTSKEENKASDGGAKEAQSKMLGHLRYTANASKKASAEEKVNAKTTLKMYEGLANRTKANFALKFQQLGKDCLKDLRWTSKFQQQHTAGSSSASSSVSNWFTRTECCNFIFS